MHCNRFILAITFLLHLTGHHGLPINEDKVKSFIETVERESSGQIRYAETSMRNGFGLKYIYKFFNLPFLHLKKQSLLKQLQINDREIDACNQELTIIEESDDQNYERFLYTIQNRRRENADRLSQVPKSTKPENNLTSKSIPFSLAGTSNNNLNVNEMIKARPSIIIGANHELPKSFSNSTISDKNASNSKSGSNGLKDNSLKKQLNLENESEEQAKLRQFLEDAIEVREEMNKQQQNQQIEDSDDEDQLDQPKILSYQDELDEEDQIEGQPSSILESNHEESFSKNDNNLKIEDKKLNSESDEKLNIDKSTCHNSKIIKKESKLIINLVDDLPDKSILDKDKSKDKNKDKSQSTKAKKKKSKKSLKENSGSSSRKEKKIEDLLGPCLLIAPLDEGPTNNDDYLAL